VDENAIIHAQITELKNRKPGSELNTNPVPDITTLKTKEEQAAEEQAERSFDTEDIYDTLIDPFPIFKKKLNVYCKVAVEFYASGEFNTTSFA